MIRTPEKWAEEFVVTPMMSQRQILAKVKAIQDEVRYNSFWYVRATRDKKVFRLLVNAASGEAAELLIRKQPRFSRPSCVLEFFKIYSDTVIEI